MQVFSFDLSHPSLVADPAIDIARSSTRKEELLLDKDEVEKTWLLRKVIADMPSTEVMEKIMKG